MLFDLDGVLVDSEGEYSKFWGAIGDRYNRGAGFNNSIKGSTLVEILSHFPEEDRTAIADELHEFERHMEFEVYPGVKQFLASLHKEGIPAAIVTSSDNFKMECLFARHPEIKEAVGHIVTADMVSRGKPDPECFLLGARLIGVPVEDCFVFEDSMNGLKAARASGGKVVALATTNPIHAIAPLSDVVIGSFEGITPASLASLCGR